MPFSFATVSFDYEGGDGSPASGEVEFQLSTPLSNGAVTLGFSPVIVTLQNGSGSAILASTEDTGTSPPGAVWLITERMADGPARMWGAEVASGGVAVNLDDLRPQQDFG